MCHSAGTGSSVPFRVQAYVETIIHTCADGGRALVSVVLFGSSAIGGWLEIVSDVDLILVVPDTASDKDMERLRTEVERIEVLHRLCTHSAHGQPVVEKLLDWVTANVRSFFICTRGDLLSGNIGRILGLHPSQAIFVDRIVLANIVTSGITVWGEAMLPLIPVAPIRRFDVFKAFFGLFPTALLCAAWGQTARSYNCRLCAASIGIRSPSSSVVSPLWYGSTGAHPSTTGFREKPTNQPHSGRLVNGYRC